MSAPVLLNLAMVCSSLRWDSIHEVKQGTLSHPSPVEAGQVAVLCCPGARSSTQADSGSSEDEAASEARSTTSDCPSLLSTTAEDCLGERKFKINGELSEGSTGQGQDSVMTSWLCRWGSCG